MAWSQSYSIPFSTPSYEFHLHGLSDLQIGSTSTSISVIKSRIYDICKDPFDSGVIVPGDIEDEDRPSTRSMRRSVFADRPEVPVRDAQKHMAWIDKNIIPLLMPLQKTKYGIMGVLAGHHWTQITPALNSVQYICQEISRLSNKKVNYLGEMSSFMDIRFIGFDNIVRRVVGHIQHGEGGGQTKAASLNKLDRATQGFIADFYIRAHDCQIVASKTDQLYPKEMRKQDIEPVIMSKTVVMLNLGAATKGYEVNKTTPSYIESKMMRPTALGWGSIKFKIKKAHSWEDPSKNMKVYMSVEI